MKHVLASHVGHGLVTWWHHVKHVVASRVGYGLVTWPYHTQHVLASRVGHGVEKFAREEQVGSHVMSRAAGLEENAREEHVDAGRDDDRGDEARFVSPPCPAACGGITISPR